MGHALSTATLNNIPPRSTPEKIRTQSLARSRELLKNGIPANLTGAAKRAAEAEYKVALYRQQHGLL